MAKPMCPSEGKSKISHFRAKSRILHHHSRKTRLPPQHTQDRRVLGTPDWVRDDTGEQRRMAGPPYNWGRLGSVLRIARLEDNSGEAVLCWGLGQREPDLETGVAGLGVDLDVAAVLFHDAQGSVESEACAFADSLGGEERFEDVRIVRRVKSPGRYRRSRPLRNCPRDKFECEVRLCRPWRRRRCR